VSKLTNRDIQRIIRQWLKEKPVADSARDFQVIRQRVYQLITLFKEIKEYPELKQPGRKPQPIDDKTEELILESFRTTRWVPPIWRRRSKKPTGFIFLITGSIRYYCSTAWWRLP